MLYLFLLLVIGETALADLSCDYVVLLEKGVAQELPNYPFERPPVFCHWTVISEGHRVLMISCTNTGHPDSVTEDTNPCYGSFEISDDTGNVTKHCRDRGFARVIQHNRMFIKYNEKPEDENSDYDPSRFKCYVYSELKQDPFPEDYDVTDLVNYDECKYDITLDKHSLLRLDNPKHIEEDPSWKGCHWSISGPVDRKVSIDCPFTDKPPEPITTQMLRCAGYFVIKYADEVKQFLCRVRSFSVTSTDNKMDIYYVSPNTKRYEDFECYVYLEPEEIQPAPENVTPYSKCEHYIEMASNDVIAVGTPDYPEKPPQDLMCRWILEAPPNYRIAMNCLYPRHPITYDESIDHFDQCNGELNLTLGYDQEARYCINDAFYRYSHVNFLIMTFRNPTNNPTLYFKCFASLEEITPDCTDCTGVGALYFENCKKHINITSIETYEELKSPFYPTPLKPGSACMWTVTGPKDSQIQLKCDFPNRLIGDARCHGYFTVYAYGTSGEQAFCYDAPFSVLSKSEESTMYITYGGQVRDESFKCELTALNEQCEKVIKFESVKDSIVEELAIAPWPEEKVPFDTCTWHFEAPLGYRLNVTCTWALPMFRCKRMLLVSTTGDRYFRDAQTLCFEEIQDVTAEEKLSLQFVNRGGEPLPPGEKIGCTVYLDKRPLCDCGISSANGPAKQGRIAGGTVALPEEYPMMAALEKIQDQRLICGATIISDHHALTAGRCLTAESIDTNDIDIGLVVGRNNLQEGTEMTKVHNVDQMIIHENFAAEPFQYDVGLVYVSETITFSTHVSPACLPFLNKDFDFQHQKFYALGWGSDQSETRHELSVMNGYIDSNVECNYLDSLSSEQGLCLRHVLEDDVCKMDTGGPVLWLDPDLNRFKLIGILYANECQHLYRITATAITPFLDWIDENTPGVRFCKN